MLAVLCSPLTLWMYYFSSIFYVSIYHHKMLRCGFIVESVAKCVGYREYRLIMQTQASGWGVSLGLALPAINSWQVSYPLENVAAEQ